jgi:hypothetical protein
MRTTMSDWQLLQAYARSLSEAAFTELVRLHLDWVYFVALRRAGDPHLAADVVPSVFLRLARKAIDLAFGWIRCIVLISRGSNRDEFLLAECAGRLIV